MKCALIGLGMVADTHVAALNASRLVSLHGVLGRDPSKTSAFAARHGGLMIYDDLNALAQDPEIDFVIVATPPDARLEIIDVLSAASKPTLMEKPIERTLPAAQNLVALCDKANVTCGIVFQHRARAASRALKQMISNGDLGEIASIDIRVPWWRAQSYYDAPGRGTFSRDGGGVMITQAIHTLDLALWFGGPVHAVQALMHTTQLHTLEAEDWAGALLQFESGAVGTLMATSAAYPGAGESIHIQGTKAAAHLASGVLKLDYLDGSHDEIGELASTGGGADPMAFTHEWHQTVIEDFASAIAQNHAPLAPASEGLHVHSVITAMEAASASGQRTMVTQ
ncbi:MAG: Gfo/Idh/MocA family oxidoreductase [Aliishimia sp.]